MPRGQRGNVIGLQRMSRILAFGREVAFQAEEPEGAETKRPESRGNAER